MQGKCKAGNSTVLDPMSLQQLLQYKLCNIVNLTKDYLLTGGGCKSSRFKN